MKKNSNRFDGFREDIEIEHSDHKEELVKPKIEEMENKFSHEVDCVEVIALHKKGNRCKE